MKLTKIIIHSCDIEEQGYNTTQSVTWKHIPRVKDFIKLNNTYYVVERVLWSANLPSVNHNPIIEIFCTRYEVQREQDEIQRNQHENTRGWQKCKCIST